MTIPVSVLLAFAGWTLLILIVGVGIDRWSKILTRQARLVDFPADVPHGGDRYRRAMRAHANCIENLPVYGAVVVAIVATGISGPTLDRLALVLLGARVVQTLVHVVPARATSPWIAVRFTFFFAQVACLVWMGTLVATRA